MVFHVGLRPGQSAALTVLLCEHIAVQSIDELLSTVRGSEGADDPAGGRTYLAHTVYGVGSPEAQRGAISSDFVRWTDHFAAAFRARLGRLLGTSAAVSSDLTVAHSALSSMLGGIGHFHGSPRVGDGVDLEETQSAARNALCVGPAEDVSSVVSLLSGTPSRTVFPRGFLWDEGFHQLLVSQWDLALTQRVLSDWLAAMHFPSQCAASETCVGGWIPREMILGAEALRRVPEEFVTQRVNIANPPTFLLVVESLLGRHFPGSAEETCPALAGDSCAEPLTAEQSELLVFLGHIYPQLHQWVQWFLVSQRGSEQIPGSFRWRGRSLADNKVVPNTLASGLDDYPRSPLPSPEEHHVDLHSWATTACAVMARLELVLSARSAHLSAASKELLDQQLNSTFYPAQHKYLLERLQQLHWSEQHRGFFDVGLNSENATFATEIYFKCAHPATQASVEISVPVEIARTSTDFCPPSHPKLLFPIGDGSGGYKQREVYVLRDPQDVALRHVPRVGYVSLFPLLLKHIDAFAHPDRLGAVLDCMEDPQQLWTEHGLRSMSKGDRFYNKRNSPGDAPYWRAPIWINVNYLAIAALRHYAAIEGHQHQARSQRLYSRLRANVMRTVGGQYLSTGHFWEQYDDSTGEGFRGHPFTGWTALVVNIIAEKF